MIKNDNMKRYFHRVKRYMTVYENHLYGKVQVGKDQEKAQSEKDSHSKNRGQEATIK